MQVLDIDDDAEFLTQGVSEERVAEIMRQAMANRGKVKDAETLQSYICQAEQRLTEKSPLSVWLMKPFLRGLCLRIHAVIAMGYIFSPVGEVGLWSKKRGWNQVFFFSATLFSPLLKVPHSLFGTDDTPRKHPKSSLRRS